MSMKKMRSGAFLLSLLAAGGAASTAAAADYHYMFQKERMPLALDTTRIALFSEATEQAAANGRGVNAAHEGLAQSAAIYGLDADTMKPHSLRGWTYIDTPRAERAEEDVENIVLQMSGNQAADFISPVFVDEYGPRFVKRDLIIGFEPDITQEEADRVVAEMNLGVILDRELSGMKRTYLVRSDSRDGFQVLAKANQVALRPEVAYAEPDMIFTATTDLIPNDQNFGTQWAIRNTGQSGGTVDMDMDGDEAWDITIGASSVISVVLDDGIQLNHPDLINNMAPSADFTGSGTGGDHISTNACEGHGTNVAGTIAATINNFVGISGIAPGTRVASAKFAVLNVPCDGTAASCTSCLVAAINYTTTIGARVLNISYSTGSSGSVEAAFLNTRNAGVVHFASTGNGGTGSIAYPASSPSVNGVGAITRTGARASFSQFGPGTDFVAPGNSVLSTNRNNGYATVSGTSFSSPYAAGNAALVLSRNNTLSATDVELVMRNSTMDLGAAGYDQEFGFGLVNALNEVLNTPPPSPPGPFNLTAPANGALNQARFASFSWTSALAAQTYELTVDDNSDFSSPFLVDSTNFTNYTISGTPLAASTTYFWKVRAINSLGSTVGSPASLSFSTISVPPLAFNLVSPTNGQTGVSTTPTFAWDIATYAEGYTFEFASNAGFVGSASSATTNNGFSISSPLNAGATYFWRVYANNPLGSTLATPGSRSFTTVALPPESFSLLLPPDGNNVSTTTPTLDWADANGVVTYRVQIDDDLAFSSLVLDQSGLAVSTFTVPQGTLQTNIRYYWRIYAVNGAGQTQGAPGSFSFGVLAPTCCPGNADKVSPGSVTFGDVTTALGNFGNSYPGSTGQGDADCNGAVNFGDITSILGNFGQSCP